MDGGKFKRKLSEVNTRAGSRKLNELVGKLKMVAGDKVLGDFLLNFPPSIPRNPWWHLFKNSLVTPSVACVHIHSF